MKCDRSLEDFAVLQRTAENAACHAFRGRCRATGKVLLTANRDGAPLPGWRGREVGSAARGRFRGVIDGLPAGGPYTLSFAIVDAAGRVLERTSVRDVLVGDLWIMAGQSNMQGYGYMPSPVPENPLIHNFYMDNRWGVAREPLHNLAQAAAPVHGASPFAPVVGKPPRGVGPGLAFAAEMLRFSGVPQGLIACAHGGTSMAQWDPALKKKGDFSLYGATVNRLRRLGGRVAGVIWYQGCHEAFGPEMVRNYTPAMKKLIAAFRRDCRDPELPVVIAQLSRYANDLAPAGWTAIRCQQLELLRKVRRLGLAVTIDLELDDQIHLSGPAQKVCGERMACAMRRLLGDDSAPTAPVPKSCVMSRDPVTSNLICTVTFSGVRGSLRAAGRPSGFALLDEDGEAQTCCFRTEPDGNRVHVHIRSNYYIALASPPVLAYGAGDDPYCNICDEAGMPLPAFRLASRRKDPRVAGFVRFAGVTAPVCGGEAANLALPAGMHDEDFTPASFSDGFYLTHPRRKEFPLQTDGTFYYRFRVRAPEAMELDVLFGSDASFVFYWDGRELMRKNTANPIVPDEFSVRVAAAPGVHECVVAQSFNHGNAWGICCRFRRKDRGALPEVLPPSGE